MVKLLKYAEPYILSIIASIILLFGQAICDLSLPDYMSDIINKGITVGDYYKNRFYYAWCFST